jgi:hypothetical protein
VVPDGSGESGPAIRIAPAKTEHPDLFRWKHLGDQEAELVEVRLLIQRRLYTEYETNGWLRPRPRAMPEDWYIFAGTIIHPCRRPNPQTVSRRTGGSIKQELRLAQGVASTSLKSPALRRSAHRLRRRSYQDIKRAAEKRLEADGIRGVSADAVVHAAHDRDIPSDSLGYADISSEAGREKWARFGIRAASVQLWTREGASLVPDASRFEAALRGAIALEAAHAQAYERLAEHNRDIQRKGAQIERVDIAVLLAAMDEESRLRRKLSEASTAVERLRDDPATYVELPDDDDPGAESVDLDEIESRVRGKRAMADRPTHGLRDWVTVVEFADALGIGPATARRWVTGKLPHPDGDPRNPWDAENVPVDESRGPKRRRISLQGIRPGSISEAQRESLEARTHHWPMEQTPPRACLRLRDVTCV